MSEAVLLNWEGDPYAGQVVAMPGHNLDADHLRRVAIEWFGEGVIGSAEIWADRMKRVKWCERYDGWGCDSNGEWHQHWYAVKPNPNDPSIQWTLIWEQPDE